MVAIHLDDPTPQDGGAASDTLRRVVHAALALYLLPAFLLVMAVGGLLLLIQGVAAVVGGLVGLPRRLRASWPSRADDPTRRPRLAVAPVRSRSRVVGRLPRS